MTVGVALILRVYAIYIKARKHVHKCFHLITSYPVVMAFSNA